MDISDHESTFQYFKITNNIVDEDDVTNISNEESNLIGIDDILNLPVNDNDVDNGSINDNSNQNDNNDDEDDDTKQIFYVTFDGKTDTELNDSDIKLITLDDGRMFMATGDDLHSSIVIKDEVINEANQSSSGSKNDNVNYQLIQLSDGTQAVIKLYKINEAVKVKEENASKKVKKYHCNYEGCPKVYATSYHLTVHMRTHTDSRPYGCYMDGCAKRFSTNYSLKAHIRTHTGEKPYGCSVCIKQFKTSGDLQKHTRTHTGEKPFMCPIDGCGKSFTTSNIRKVHIRSHTGERPYSCNYPNCGKAFTSSTNYKNHLRIHSGEKPYVCPIEGCNKRFTEYSSLYKHNAVHQTIKSFSCVFCGQFFKQESALNYHKRTKHNVVITQDGKEIIVQMVKV